MAVFTKLLKEDIEEFISDYSIGSLESFEELKMESEGRGRVDRGWAAQMRPKSDLTRANFDCSLARAKSHL